MIRSSSFQLTLFFLLLIPIYFARLGETEIPSWDDAFYAEIAKETAPFGTPLWLGEPRAIPPLTIWITSLSMKILGRSEYSVRLPYALMGYIGIILVFTAGSIIGGRSLGFYSAFLLVISPYYLKHSGHIGMNLPLAFFNILSFVFYLFLLKRNKMYMLFFIFTVFLGILTKSFLGLFILLPAVLYLVITKEKETLRVFMYSISILFVLLILGLLYLLNTPIGESIIHHHIEGSVLKILVDYPFQSVGVFLWNLVKNGEPLFVAVLVTLLMRKKMGMEERKTLLLLSLFAFGILIQIPLFMDTRGSTYLLQGFPFLALLGGLGLTVLLKDRFYRILKGIVLFFVIVAIFYLFTPLKLHRNYQPYAKELGLLARIEVPEDEDVFYIGREYWYFAPTFVFYSDRAMRKGYTDLKELLNYEPYAKFAAGRAELLKEEKILGVSQGYLLVEIER